MASGTANGSAGSLQQKHDSLTEWYNSFKERIEELNDQIQQTQAQKGNYEDFLTAIFFDVFNTMADSLTVNSEGDINVTFRKDQTIHA